jgi:type I restriction enzyme S subunit
VIGDLKPYTEYKESGLPWLGQVPGRWSVERTKWRFRHRKEPNTDGAHTNVLSLTLRGVVNNNPDDPEGLVPKDYRTYQFFAKGDLVFKLIDLENLRTSRVGLVHEDGIMSSAYVRLVPSSPTNMRYFFHQFYDLYARGVYNQLGAGVRSTLGPSDLLNVGIVIPPPDEQAAIVRFLDWANGRLDRAIRAKRKVIALLNEQKQAIIHRAVTRGLDPAVPLKPSGSRWFPELPTGWEALTLRQVITSAIDGPHFSPRYQDAGIPFLSARNVRADRWILSDVKFISEADYIEFSRRVRPEVGDVLYTKGGTTGVARAVDLTFPFQVWVHIAVLRLRRNRMLPAFLAYCLNSPRCYEQAQLFTRGATNQDLGLGRMKDIELPVPPTLNEQSAIVDSLDPQCSGFTTAIARLEREIELLREYRTRLVADVVTGKLDVREAAAWLPDEAPPGTAEDDTGLSDENEAAEEEVAV